MGIVQGDFYTSNCPACDVEFVLYTRYEQRRRRDGHSFYCPNGHSMSFGDTEADKLRRERNLLKQQMAQKDDEIAAERRRAVAAKGELTKLKKRTIVNGVCPCCTRSFLNLKNHMKTQHPDYNVVPMKEKTA